MCYIYMNWLNKAITNHSRLVNLERFTTRLRDRME